MNELMFPIIGMGVLGLAASQIMANRKVRKMQRYLMKIHVQGMTALGDAAIDVMTVRYGAPIKEAMAFLKEEATRRLPNIVMPEVDDKRIAKAQEIVDKKRAALKESASGEPKQD